MTEFRKIELSNDHLELQLMPDLGAKLITLRRRGGPNVLLEPPDFPYRRAKPYEPFENYDTSGFDECFPTVAACRDPDEPTRELPDHGELWSGAWETDANAERVHCTFRGKLYPYEFHRTATLRGSALRLDYELRGPTRRHFVWSCHPLLKVSEGSRIFLPQEVKSLRIESSRGDRLGKKGDRTPWNQALATIGPRSLGYAEKLFTDALTEGFCAFWDAATNQTTEFRFDVQKTPFVGLWICQGGWPESRPSKHYTVALEPCSGRYDALDEAVKRGEARVVPESGSEQWWLEITLRDGRPGR